MIPMPYLLPFIILVEGFSSIAIEILSIRQLLPVAGGSVIVTSLIIGIFLLFLALGYERGGRAKHNLNRTLQRNFFLVALWSGIGLSYVFIKWFFEQVQLLSGPHVVYALIAYLILIIAPAIFLLGQTLPIIMNIVKQDEKAGVIAGKALALSTIGSFLGAVFTTLVMMHYFGVAWTLFIVFLLLVALSLLLSKSVKILLVTLTLSTVSGFIVYMANVDTERKTMLLTNNYANYQILDKTNSELTGGAKILVINETLSSYTDEENNAFEYIEEMRKRIFEDLELHDAEILVLGAGGFTLSAGDTRKNHFTYVDIDPSIRKIVEPKFMKEIKDKLVINDARNYLNTTDKQFSIIVVDVYSDYKAIPAHLLTREFMMSVKAHLLNDGYAMFNIIANPTFKDAYSKRIDNTIRSAFGSCVASPIQFGDHSANIVYMCGKNARPDDHVIYVDNLNNSTTDSFSW